MARTYLVFLYALLAATPSTATTHVPVSRLLQKPLATSAVFLFHITQAWRFVTVGQNSLTANITTDEAQWSSYAELQEAEAEVAKAEKKVELARIHDEQYRLEAKEQRILDDLEGLQAAMAGKNPKQVALIIIDVQECFLDVTSYGNRGSLGVDGTGGPKGIIPVINMMRAAGDNKLWNTVVISQDFHPKQHVSFASSHGKTFDPAKIGTPEMMEPLTCLDPNKGALKAKVDAGKATEADASCCPTKYLGNDVEERWKSVKACRPVSEGGCAGDDDLQLCKTDNQMLWPDHCQQGVPADHGLPTGDGAAGLPKLVTKDSDLIVLKGTNPDVDSYSALLDNTGAIQTRVHFSPVAKEKNQRIHEVLKERGVDTIVLVGIAEDVCVKFTALHAAEGDTNHLGSAYKVWFVTDAMKGAAGQEKDTEAMLRADADKYRVLESTQLMLMKSLDW